MSTAGVAPAGTGASVLGVAVAREAVSGAGLAYTGQPTRLVIAAAIIVTAAGILLVFFGRDVAELPHRELGSSRRRIGLHSPSP
jgi:hypothetical protein